MNARRAELGAKEEVIEEAFSKASDELKEIASSNSEEYNDSLNRMIKEAADEIGGNNFIIQLNEADTEVIKGQLKESSSDDSTFQIEDITFELGEPIDAIGGAVLRTSNGDIEVNNTIEARLERYKSVLRSEVANILFK